MNKFDKERIRIMAEAERMMDSGEIPYVIAPSNKGLERMAVASEIMDELGLTNGQTVNSCIIEAIFKLSLEKIVKRLDETADEVENQLLDPNFDFRKML